MEVGIVLVVAVMVAAVVMLARSGGRDRPARPQPARARLADPRPVAVTRAEAGRTAQVEREQREARALRGELAALEAAARALPDGSPAGPVLAAGLRLTVQDQAARTVAAGLREPVPVLAGAAADDDPVRPVESFFTALHRNAVAVAGVEQLAVAGLAAAVADAAPVPDVLLALAAAPEHVTAAADGLVAYLQDPQAQVAAVHAAGAVFGHALHSILPTVAPFDPGLVGALAKTVFTQGNLGVAAGTWAGQQVAHGLQDLAEQAGQATQVAEAVAHLDQAADAVVGAFAVDAAFGSHIPVITGVVSGFREIRLLQQGRTEAAVAAKNIALDVAGTGLGATIGGWLGGAAGTVVAPGPGTVGLAVVGAGIGGAIGRSSSNKLKNWKLRKAQDDLDRIREEVPGRLRLAATELHEAVAGRAATARAVYAASVGAPPRLAAHRAEIDAMTAELRAATGAYLREVDDAVARSRGLAAAGHGPPPDLPRSSVALALTRAAVSTGGDGPALLALCTLAQAGPPVAAQGRLGAAYRACAHRTAGRLERLAAAHARELRAWTTHAATLVRQRTAELTAAPELGIYRERATAAATELGAATERVTLEAGRLGR